MKILVLGNIDSKWVKEYIEFVLLPLGHEVEIVGDEKKCVFREFYEDNRVKIHHYENPGRIIAKIPYFRIFSSAARTVKNNSWNDYDIIINMFVNTRDLRITSKIKGANTKVVVYFTGSDLLRQSRRKIRLDRMLMPKVDKYVVGGKMLLADFDKKLGDIASAQVINFGISAFDNVDRYLSTNPNREKGCVFCVGYSGVEAHQHLRVLSLFEDLPQELKEKARIVVPMTYMATAEYVTVVKNRLEEIKIPYRLLTDFMNNEQMAEMWCNIDFLIHAQTSDSLSASVLESMYAGCTLINPTWLDYPEYKEQGLDYLKFKDFSELQDIICRILNDQQDIPEWRNHDKLRGFLSWETAKNKWNELLKSFKI